MQGDLSLFKRLWPFARPDSHLFGLALLLTPITTGLALAQPYVMKRVVDDHVTTGQLDGLQQMAALYLGAVILHYVLTTVYSLCIALAGQRTVLRLREGVVRHLLGLAPSFFDKRPAGELLTRATSDVEALGETISGGVVTILLDILMVVGVLTAMLVLDWRMTLSLFLVAPPLIVVIEVCRRNLRTAFNRIRETLAQVNAYLAEQVDGMAVVQLFGHEDRSVDRFVELNTPYKDATIRSNIFDAAMYAAVDGIGSICIGLMLAYAVSGFAGDGITAGLVVAFIDYLNRLFRPIREFSGKVAIIQRAGAALSKIFALVDTKESIEDGGNPMPHCEGHVRFDDVRFAYTADADEVIRGVSLSVEPGQVVAIVGPTGCGKTTLTRLLTRSYQGYRGSITLDGQEVSGLALKDLRRHVAAVRQDIHLFAESIAFNVGLGVREQDQMQEAARLVNADGFIDELGWDHELRDGGSNLSVGQGQLLTFARTMAYDPTVVILDEATASVDPVTEALIQQAIGRILEQKTVIVIAHRLSTIRAADRIVVLKRGEVVESGTHEELLEMGGEYARLNFAEAEAQA